MSNNHTTIAICGIRGIPACYGGFETFAEEVAPRLVKAGHKVRVYGRSHVIDFKESHYKGVEIVLLPAPKHKYLETIVHTILCIIHLLFNRVDAVLVCNGANSPFIWILRLFRIPVIVNVDGIERLRAKWNKLGKLWYLLGEWCSVKFASQMVSDAKVISDYYESTYGASSKVITYGYSEVLEAEVEKKVQGQEFLADNRDIFDEFGLEAKTDYLLYVSRLEPENNALLVVEAYNELVKRMPTTPPPLIIVGDAPYARAYVEKLKATSGPGVIFAGYRFGEVYSNLQLGALVYIQATEVGGTHPALVEAMGFGNCVLANGTPENIEVLADAGVCFSKNDKFSLAEELFKLVNDKVLVQELRKKARLRAKQCYSWSKITSEYSALANSLSSTKK